MRIACRLTAEQVAAATGLSVAAIRSYESATRNPPIAVLEKVLNVYGHTLTTVPILEQGVRVREDMVADLRAIADQLEGLEPIRVNG